MREGRVIVLSDYVGGGAASGGAGLVVLDGFRALRARGVDARLIVGFGEAPPGVEPDRFRSLGGADLREGGASGAARAVYNPAARGALRSALADADPGRTVVVLHQWTRYLSPAAIGLLGRFRVMVYMHDYFWACPNGAYYDFKAAEPCGRRPMGAACVTADCDRSGRVTKAGRVARHAALELLRRGASADRLVLHLSERAHRVAAPLLPRERHAIVHNPLSVPADPPAPAPAPTFDVGYFGRLEPEKGVGRLLEAVDALGLTGLMVGQGALEPAIRARPMVEHHPWRPRDAMADAMRRCAVVVLPSLWNETWGLVVPEAMAAGVRVLVSERAGSAEMVRRFGGGSTFDPGVPGDLEAKLRLLLGGEPPVAAARHAELRAFLSGGRHADRLVELAASRWNIDLGPGAPVSPVPRPTAPALRPA